jgi:hypothetical protein
MICSDLASNDFNRLFGALKEARNTGVFGKGVYPSAVAGSFDNPLSPPATVHLATCFSAIHWLDLLPRVALHDSLSYRRPHPAREGIEVSPRVAAAFARQAEHDMLRFLECRGRELVPGGNLLSAGPGDTDEARFADGIADLLNDACLDLVASGCLQRQQYGSLTMPVYFRTLDELLATLQ